MRCGRRVVHGRRRKRLPAGKAGEGVAGICRATLITEKMRYLHRGQASFERRRQIKTFQSFWPERTPFRPYYTSKREIYSAVESQRQRFLRALFARTSAVWGRRSMFLLDRSLDLVPVGDILRGD